MSEESSNSKIASLAIIDYEALIRKDPSEIQKLAHAGQTVGMFYLDLRGSQTKAIFADMPEIFQTSNSFFNLPSDSTEKSQSIRTGVERGFHSSKGFEYYEHPRFLEMNTRVEIGSCHSHSNPKKERITGIMKTFNDAIHTVLTQLCESVGVIIPELSDDFTISSDTALKLLFKHPIHEVGQVINGAHTDFGLATLLWYDEETTQILVHNEDDEDDKDYKDEGDWQTFQWLKVVSSSMSQMNWLPSLTVVFIQLFIV